ncbi:MAG TPA: type II secretion system F family protein [Stellaceae bacterium]|nr:type II secretion system F family protein [Stellaceae bacterium]
MVSSQLATLLKAGLVLDDALSILEELVEAEREKASIRGLIEAISGGRTLAEALTAQKPVFPDYFINLVRAGEAGGNLELVFERIADFIERRQAAKEHIKSAMLYPAIVGVACCVSIAILLLVVVPQFQPLFEQSANKDTLPPSARWLMAASDGLRAYWWLGLIIVAGIILAGYGQIRSAKSSLRWQRRILKIPLVGELVRKIEVARFSRALGTLLKSEVPLLSALAIARDSTANIVFAEAIEQVIERAKTGKGLAEPLRSTQVFPPLAIHLVRIGEESGRHDEMLTKIADIFEAETRRTIDRLLTLMAPTVTIVLGVVVAGVIVSMLSALLSVYDLAM